MGDESLNTYNEGTYTPVVTLVGGSGNVVPVYSTVSGRFTQIGNRCIGDVFLFGDGGAEGAGTGEIHISLPITQNASAVEQRIFGTYAYNSATTYIVESIIESGASTDMRFNYISVLGTESTFSGVHQNNSARQINIQFNYEV